MLYSGKDLTGRAGDLALQLLKSEDEEVLRAGVHALWGAKVSPAIEARLLEFARAGNQHEVFYFALSTLENKSAAVIDHLFQAAQDSDWNVYWRAIWGLGHGIPEEHHPKVAGFLAQYFEARSDGKIRRNCLEMLGRYGGEAELPAIEGWAANPLIGEELRRLSAECAEKIRGRRR
jgi:hypothetical protein